MKTRKTAVASGGSDFADQRDDEEQDMSGIKDL